jgi:Family of unknown function (DUF6152)
MSGAPDVRGRQGTAASRAILVGLVATTLLAVTVDAHHSIAADYDASRSVKIEGVLKQFHFVNPHPFVVADVDDGSGQAREWRLELDNRVELAAVGITTDTFKSGDRIVVVGSPARRQANSMYVRRLDRPADGFWYEQVGASPRIRR